MQRNRFAILILPSLLAACAVGPDYRAPDVDTGSGWATPVAEGTPEIDLSSWWQSFEDPTLDRLIETALAANLDVRQSAARVAVSHVRSSRTRTCALRAACCSCRRYCLTDITRFVACISQRSVSRLTVLTSPSR